MPKKKRVYEVARDLNISSEALLELIRALGVQVKSHMSAVDDSTVEALHGQFQREKEKIKEADVLKRERRRQHDHGAGAATATAAARSKAPASRVKQVVRKSTAAASGTVAAGPAPPPPAAPPAKPVAAAARPAAASKPAAAATKPAAASGPAPAAPPAATPPAAAGKGTEPTAPARKRAVRVPPAARPAPPRRQPHVFRPSQSAIVTGRRPAPVHRRPGGAPGPAGGAARGIAARSRPAPRRPTAGGPPPPPPPGAGPRRRKDKKKKTFDQKKVRENVRRTMQMIGGRRRPKRRRKGHDAATAVVEEDRTLRVTEFITLGELADMMDESPTDLIGACMKLGVMATINQRLDKEIIVAVTDDLDYEVEFITEYGADQIEVSDEGDDHPEPRPPVVTVMGHVDHGKTTLLDYVRRTNVAGHEAGHITQHIGAYSVVHGGRPITFLDTPGHAAFTAMRSRGAQATDIVVLVVAADDKVMPQTIEAINHARAADVPIVVAINKIDLPGADPEGVKQGLLRHGIVVEDLGGETVAVPISAKQGTHVDQLLDMVLLLADMKEFKADPDRHARGVVLEAKVEQGRGMVASVLVQRGTLRVGDAFVCGVHCGKVRALHDEDGTVVKEAGPSLPVEVLGWNGLPQAGDAFAVLAEEREAHDIAHQRQILAREQQLQRGRPMTLADLHSRLAAGAGAVELNLIVKGDVDGSVQALVESLGQIPSDEVKLDIVHSGVGNISESDVLLAAASEAVIIGFHVRTEARASAIAHEKGVDIHLHRVIYEAVDTIKRAMEGLLKAEEREVVLGAAEVRQVFRLPKLVVAGCHVTEGKIERAARVRVFRGGETLFSGRIGSLKRFKDDVRDVAAGYECGIALDGFDRILSGDVIESFRIEEVARTLG